MRGMTNFTATPEPPFIGALAKRFVPEGKRFALREELEDFRKIGSPFNTFLWEVNINHSLLESSSRSVIFSFLQSHLIFSFFWFYSSAYELKKKQWEDEERQTSTGGETRNLLLWFWHDSRKLLCWNDFTIFCRKIFIIVALVSVVRYISRCFRALYNFLFSGSCGAADTLTHCPVLPMNTHTPAFPSHTCPSYTFCIAGEQQKPELLALCRERSLKLAVCFKQNLKIVFHARWRGFVTKEILTISDTTIPPCSLISGHHYR